MVAAEAALLRDAGHDVLTYAVQNPSTPIAAAASLAAAPWNPRAARRLRAFAERCNPDVIHVHNTWFALSPAAIGAVGAIGLPVVMTLHNYRLVCANGLLFRDGAPCDLCVASHPWHAVRYRCYRDSTAASAAAATTIALNRAIDSWHRNVGVFFALTEFARRKFVDGGLPAHKISVKPHFVFDPGARSSPPSSSSVAIFVGRLSAEKGVATLIRAWTRAGMPGLRLRVIGDGPMRAQLEEEAGPSVEFTGPVSRADVRREMLGARCLLFPSLWYETQGMVILEALSAGLPVMGSARGAALEVLEALDDRWRRRPGDEESWVDGLRELEDDDAVDTGGAQGRTLYQERYTPERALSRLVAGYERAASAA